MSLPPEQDVDVIRRDSQDRWRHFGRDLRAIQTADNRLKTLKAKNSETGDQTTTWVYGTTLSYSDVARNDLVRAKEFPDKASASDRVKYKYNRLGEVKEIQQSRDRIGTVRVLEHHKLGREVHDRVTTLGARVDGVVRRISRTYKRLDRLKQL